LRLAQWNEGQTLSTCTGQQLFLIGELKKLTPARRAFDVTIKHIPDQSFEIDLQTYQRMCGLFCKALSLWEATTEARLIIAAMFNAHADRAPQITCLYLMPVSVDWLPTKDLQDLARLQQLVIERRGFVVGYPHRSLVVATK
jgi:hypothetical protein